MKTNPTDEIVLATLRKSAVPMSAYAILDSLKKHGVKSPPLVYRALEKLTRRGTAHRVDALGSYVACSCEHEHQHPISVLTICRECKKVSELHDANIMVHLAKLRELGVALTDNAVIELPVLCKGCG